MSGIPSPFKSPAVRIPILGPATIGAAITGARAGPLTRIFMPPRAFCGHAICIIWPPMLTWKG
jgi:hypothetical protein